ncbi:hypothetical protein J6O48_13815 [bacterium]|nr:hypothetical protein [bacterium]
MDYKEKYETALGIAKMWHKNTAVPKDCKAIFERMFPELQESEDERIKNEIIDFVEQSIHRGGGTPIPQEQENKWIAWLEKHSNIDKTSYEIAEKEKYDFVSGQFIECRKSFNEFKEDNSYWFEYIGNDTYIGRSDNIINKKFHITPRQLYRLFTQQHCPKENNVNEETNGPTAYGKYVDECLYEAAKHFFSEGEDKYTVADLFYAGIRCVQSWLEKQAKQTHAVLGQSEVTKTGGKEQSDNVEPKFHEGDWVVNEVAGSVYQIRNCVENLNNHKYGYDLTNGGYIGSDEVNYYHLWAIQDAKDGDVLVASDGSIFLFAGVVDCACKYYAALTTDNYVKINKDTKGGYWETSRAVYPATKEQRDLLFQKMKEGDYEWDVEKKKVNKIEQIPVDKVEQKFKVGKWYQCTKDFFGKGVTFNKNTAYYCAKEGCLKNEYGCHIAIIKDLYDNFKLWDISDVKDGDVLVNGSNIFIFHFINDTRLMGYCHVNTNDGRFYDDTGKNKCFCLIDAIVHPATKEQRDLLFQKINEAGYEWDAEKKELKKIMQNLA